MKFLIVFLTLVLFSTFSCTETQKPKPAAPQKKKSLVTAKANAGICFKVSGMVCKMGCGGAIRKELKSTGSIESVSVDFVDGAKAQNINVRYDSTQITIAEMQAVLEKTNDGQFQVLTTCPLDEGPHK
jgi:hypothetical protein